MPRHYLRALPAKSAVCRAPGLPENSASAQATGVGNAFGLEITLPVAGQNRMPTAADYLALALSGCYAAGSAAAAELLYVRNKIALTAAEQAARKAGA